MRRILKRQAWLIGLILLLPGWAFAQLGYLNPLMMGDSAGAGGLANRIPQHLMALILGGLVGAFFSDKLREFRKFVFWLIVGLGLLGFIFLSTTTGNIACFIAGAIGAYIGLKDQIAKALKKQPPKPTTFGSAEWANLEHLVKHDLVGEEGFALGVYRKDDVNYPLQYTGDRHLLTVAPTRSGKGVSSIIPNLLTYEGSVIVIDPKGENARITADRRGAGDRLGIEGLKQTVRVVDPWGITGLPVSRFNPLDWLRPGDEDINENAMMLADSIVTIRQGTREPFWDEEAKALLMGILLYVALDEYT